MSDPWYPTISSSELATIQTLIQSMKAFPDYLGPKCTYEPEVVAILRDMVPPNNGEGVSVGDLDLERETDALYRDLKGFGDNLDNVSTAEQMQYYRVSTSLMEKLLGLKERAAGVKKVEQLFQIVLEAMELSDVPERSRFIARIRDLQKS